MTLETVDFSFDYDKLEEQEYEKINEYIDELDIEFIHMFEYFSVMNENGEVIDMERRLVETENVSEENNIHIYKEITYHQSSEHYVVLCDSEIEWSDIKIADQYEKEKTYDYSDIMHYII